MSQPPATAGPKRAVPLKVWVLLALLFGAVAGLGVFTFAYAEGGSYLSDDPAACRNCHIPHTFPDKYVVKALNGFNHSAAFTLQNFHEPIQITPFNKTVALNNCQSCHSDLVSQINHRGQADLEDCTRCHATIGHDEISVGKP